MENLRKLCVKTASTALALGLLALTSSARAQTETTTISGTPVALSKSKHFFSYGTNASMLLLGETFEYTCHIPRTVQGNSVGDPYNDYCTYDNYPSVLTTMSQKKNNVLRLEALFNHSPGLGTAGAVLDCEQPFQLSGLAATENTPCSARPASTPYTWSLVKVQGTQVVADLDPRYFKHLKDVVDYAYNKGIIVEVSLFNLWDGDWATSPFNPSNTAAVVFQGGTPCQTGGKVKPGFSNDDHFILTDQDSSNCASYLARMAQSGAVTEVIRTLRPYPNVIWEIANEPDYFRSTVTSQLSRENVFAWEQWIIGLIVANDPGATAGTAKHLIEVEGHYKNTAAWNDPRIKVQAAHYPTLRNRGQSCNAAGEPYGASELRDAMPDLISQLGSGIDNRAFSFNENVIPDGADPLRTDAAVRAEAWDFVFKRGALFDSYSVNRNAPNATAWRSQIQWLSKLFSNITQRDTVLAETCGTGSDWCQIRNGNTTQDAPFADSSGCAGNGGKLFWSALRSQNRREYDLYLHHGNDVLPSGCGGTSGPPVHSYYTAISCPSPGYQLLSPGPSLDPCENPPLGSVSLCLKPPNGCYTESWLDPATGNTLQIPDPAQPGQTTSSVDHEYNDGPGHDTWTSPKSPPGYPQDLVLRLRYKGTTCVDPELTASFTASCDFLYCTFDPGASSPSNAISNYAWDWGDGTTSSTSGAAPIVHNYSTPGSYTVTLTVSDLAGDSGAITDLVAVQAQPPTVSFNYACQQTYCGFDSFLQQGSGGIASWSWSFGDGTGSSDPNPLHTFPRGGSFDVSLQAVDVYGASTTVIRTIAVTGPAEPGFTFDCAGLTCVFDAASSTPGSSPIAAYAWSFGDGGTGAGGAPSHTFAATGTYPVTLTVTDTAGLSASLTLSVLVANPPAASFTASCQGLTCAFDAGASTPGSGTIASYGWDFGDGTAGSGGTASHTYATLGTYTVTLTVTNSFGLPASASRPVTVDALPVPSFTASCVGLACAFNASNSTDDLGISAYAWDFGDGQVAAGVTASHTYATAAAFTVTLRVTDTSQQSASVSRPAPIDLLPTPCFTATRNGLTYTFDASCSTDDQGITAYAWTFGDGQTGTGRTVTHTYAGAGSFIAGLTVTDTGNQQASTSRTVTPDPKPAACFTWTCAQRACSFDGRCSSDNQPIASYSWSFGDGTTGTGATASHTYAVGGPYTVGLTVTDSAGQTAAASNGIAVKRPPVAVNDTAAASPNTAIDINVLANDSDPDGDPLAVTGLTSPAHGTVSLNANGTVHYTPAAGYLGIDSFQYRAQDVQDVSGLATVTVTVNRAPIARDDGWSTAQNVATNIPYAALLANDYDPDGDALTVTAVNTSGLAGTLDCGSGTYCRFTPAAPFGGITSFTYTVGDGKGGTAQATVRIKVGLANSAPAPQDDLLETTRNTPLTFTRATLLANDTDPDGDVLSVTWVYLASLTSQGTVSCSGAYYTCVYTPPAGFTGVDVLYYRASDGITTADARIRVLVRPPNPAVLDAREDQMFFTTTGVFLSYAWMTANDYAPQGGALTVVGVDTTGLAGTLDCTTFSTGCQFTRGGNDPTRFRYTVRDSQGNLDTATVILKPGNGAFNQAPLVANDALVTRMSTPLSFSIFDLLRNDVDPDNDQLNVSFTTYTSAHGRLTCSSPIYTCTYTPTAGYTGTDTLTYVVNDGNNSAQGTVTVTILPLAANDAQFLSQSVPVSLFAGQSYTASLRVKNVGTATWSPVGAVCNGFRLGSANPTDNTTWGSSRADLTAPVAPGGEVTLTFTITAPQTPGTYNFQRRMLQECVTWFGDLSPNLTVTVSQ